jgi:hypothetical protein
MESLILSDPILYQALAPKIGLLSADLVIAITQFHKDFHQARRRLPLLIHERERGFTHSSLNVLIPCRDAVKKVVPALRKIERLASISIPADDLELGLTEDVIESEEKHFGVSKASSL